ncbi:MAG: molybdopterin molybdotransferase MoeA [bacterium]|nr:molybdopterin molybdotransferase MoeA [bacterium]
MTTEEMKPLAAARREVLSAMRLLPAVEVPLDEAQGLALASDVTAPHAVPSFANSAMDGYAVRVADVADPPVELHISEDVPAGHVASGSVRPGSVIKIMTGAPIPEGAEAVVKVEDTEPLSDSRVRIMASVAMDTAVRPAGGDLEEGQMVMPAGVRLGPVHLGVLATIGVSAPEVRRRARVAVLSTGDELFPVDSQSLPPGGIRDSNRPLLKGLLSDVGVEIVDMGIIPDQEDRLRAALRDASSAADVTVTSGGVSMGEYDLVKQVLSSLGDIGLWKVAMQPAKPFAFGLIHGTPLFGLPGNPVSALVAFEQFVRPSLLKMMGARALFRPRVPALAGHPLRTNPEKTVFVRVVVGLEDGRMVARSSGGQGSNVLSAAAVANGMAVVPRGVASVGEGEPVVVEMLRSPESRTEEEAPDE